MFGLGFAPYRSYSIFNPSQLSDLALWYAGDSVILNGSNVSQLTDKSNTGFNVSNSDATHQPTYNASDSVFNNQPTLTFPNGNTQYWLNNAGSGSFIIQQPCTIYITLTISQDPGQGNGNIPFDSDNDTSNRMTIFAYHNGIFSWSLFCGTIAQSGIPVNPPTNPTIAAAVYSGGNGTLYLNALTSVYGPVSVGNQGLKSLTIGSEQAHTTGFQHEGKIAEIIFCSTAHNATTIKNVMNYLGTKYNISVGP